MTGVGIPVAVAALAPVRLTEAEHLPASLLIVIREGQVITGRVLAVQELSKTETLLEAGFAVAKSGLPSPLKSPLVQPHYYLLQN